jgi:hypothetical protein
MKYSILGILICLFFFSCGNKNQGSDDPFANCKFGKPEPVFSNDIPKISSHDFRLAGKEGIEKVVFENGVHLEIIQSGCDAVRQEFQFTLTGNFENASADSWALKAIEQFQYMGAFGEKFAPFSFWANAMQQSAQHFALGQPLEVQPGAFVTIDKIFSPDYTILIVVLSQQEN